jgi:hypothetical protein
MKRFLFAPYATKIRESRGYILGATGINVPVRAAQLERVRRRTAYVRELLEQVRVKDGQAAERGLLTP